MVDREALIAESRQLHHSDKHSTTMELDYAMCRFDIVQEAALCLIDAGDITRFKQATF